jgi:hypothetical protein
MAQIDIQSTIAAWRPLRMVIPIGSAVTYSDQVPICDGQHGVMVVFIDDFGLDVTETISYGFQIFVDKIETRRIRRDAAWRDVPNESILPAWNRKYGNILYNYDSRYCQTAGFIGTASWWRVSITSTGIINPVKLIILPIAMTDVTPLNKLYDDSHIGDKIRP